MVKIRIQQMLCGVLLAASLWVLIGSAPAMAATAVTKFSAIEAANIIHRVDTIAALRLQAGRPGKQAVQVMGYYAAGDGGGGPVRRWDAASTCTDDGGACIDPVAAGAGRWVWDWTGPINARWYGATGSGTGDDAPEIQAALNLGRSVTLDIGVFRTLSELHFVNGSKLFGSGNYSGDDTLTVYPTAMYAKNSVIKYDGTGGDDVAVLRVAAEVVGVYPTDINTRNMLNVAITNVVLDGSDKAGIGLYLVRAMTNNQYDYITVTGTTRHAFLAMLCFGGGGRNWAAVINKGCGITLGKNIYGWAGTAIGAVDQCTFENLWAYRSGCDKNRAYQNQFSEASPEEAMLEYGIGLFGSRSVTFINTTASHNGGAGLYVSPNVWPFKLDGIYTEFNSKSQNANRTYLFEEITATAAQTIFTLTEFSYVPLSGSPYTASTQDIKVYVDGVLKVVNVDYTEGVPAAGATRTLNLTFLVARSAGEVIKVERTFFDPWGLWFHGVETEISRHVTFANYRLGARDQIRLTGTEPSRISEDAVIFDQVPYIPRLVADWRNYTLINCDSDPSGINGNTFPLFIPYPIKPVINGLFNLDIIGACVFQVAAGAITTSPQKLGIINTITYVSTGIYDVTFTETFATERFIVVATGNDNRVIGLTSKTTSGFRITSRTSNTAAVSDSSYVNIMVIGYFAP